MKEGCSTIAAVSGDAHIFRTLMDIAFRRVHNLKSLLMVGLPDGFN